jgi:hypothetical protein
MVLLKHKDFKTNMHARKIKQVLNYESFLS